MAWNNPDGLRLKYGTEKTTAMIGGEFRTNGQNREYHFKVDLTTLTETETVLVDTLIVPKDMHVREIEIFTQTAAATGTAIDMGLIRLDRTTEIDYNGLLAAFPTASMNAAGEKTIITDNTTYDGALVGATIGATYPGFVTMSRTDSTAFTAGLIHVTLRLYKP